MNCYRTKRPSTFHADVHVHANVLVVVSVFRNGPFLGDLGIEDVGHLLLLLEQVLHRPHIVQVDVLAVLAFLLQDNVQGLRHTPHNTPLIGPGDLEISTTEDANVGFLRDPALCAEGTHHNSTALLVESKLVRTAEVDVDHLRPLGLWLEGLIITGCLL